MIMNLLLLFLVVMIISLIFIIYKLELRLTHDKRIYKKLNELSKSIYSHNHMIFMEGVEYRCVIFVHKNCKFYSDTMTFNKEGYDYKRPIESVDPNDLKNILITLSFDTVEIIRVLKNEEEVKILYNPRYEKHQIDEIINKLYQKRKYNLVAPYEKQDLYDIP